MLRLRIPNVEMQIYGEGGIRAIHCRMARE
jgi:hypothetical protein